MTKLSRTDQRMLWVLKKIASRKGLESMVAWDEDVVDAFMEEFPESEAATVYYTMGPFSCPMLNRAANRAKARGFLRPGHIGNMDARSFNQRTWCRVWIITKEGREFADQHQ